MHECDSERKKKGRICDSVASMGEWMDRQIDRVKDVLFYGFVRGEMQLALKANVPTTVDTFADNQTDPVVSCSKYVFE